ncbi:GNAT family N-acetyltransferase, partial [Lactococcus lactis]
MNEHSIYITLMSVLFSKFFMGIFDGKELIGMVSFHKEIGEKDRHKGDIYGMFIHGDYQNKGLAK